MAWRRIRTFFRKHGWLGQAVTWIVHGYNVYFFISVAVAVLIAWASTTWAWYWATLNWAGAAIAFLVGFIVLAIGSVLFSITAAIFSRKTIAPAALAAVIGGEDKGPLVWFSNLTMDGGPLSGRPVFSLRFKGSNRSQNEVHLRDAHITSAINGAKLLLEVVARTEKGNNEVVPIDDIHLIPPGAPIELVAKFNLPAGLEAAIFLENWRRFYFNATDDTRSYRHEIAENQLAAFFPGSVGPRVTKKPQAATAT